MLSITAETAKTAMIGTRKALQEKCSCVDANILNGVNFYRIRNVINLRKDDKRAM